MNISALFNKHVSIRPTYVSIIRFLRNSSKVNEKNESQTSGCYITSKNGIIVKLGQDKGHNCNKFEEIRLITKGWSHRKSVGDHFTIHPDLQNFDHPRHNFIDIGVNNALVAALNDADIHFATDFQKDAITAIGTGKNCVLSAETGCGKTIAYLLPIIQKLQVEEHVEINKPRAVILVPNRELAHQIGMVASSLVENSGLTVKTIVGGRTKRIMLDPDFEKIDILVSTPGVLGKLSTIGIYKLQDVEFSVFDECDTLLDDSFITRTDTLLRRMPKAQVLFVSATHPKKLPDSLEPYTNDMLFIQSPRLHRPLLNVTQKFLRLTKSSKPVQLLHLAKEAKDPIIIFSNRNETSNWVALFLQQNGLKVTNINGDMNSELRINQWRDFSKGYTNILSATDVASRGLDTIMVKQILNYDFPLFAADYIHRVGRVGRLGSPEHSKITNFIAGEREIKLVQQIEMAFRRNAELENVDGNITKHIQRKIMRKIGEDY